jgi:hypothetical protein
MNESKCEAVYAPFLLQPSFQVKAPLPNEDIIAWIVDTILTEMFLIASNSHSTNWIIWCSLNLFLTKFRQ